MSKFTALLLIFIALPACGSSGGPEAPVAAEIHSALTLPDGGVSVNFDVRSSGDDVVLALIDRQKPTADVTATVIVDFGPSREHVFTRADLGEDVVNAHLTLDAVIRDGRGRVLTSMRVR